MRAGERMLHGNITEGSKDAEYSLSTHSEYSQCYWTQAEHQFLDLENKKKKKKKVFFVLCFKHQNRGTTISVLPSCLGFKKGGLNIGIFINFPFLKVVFIH